MRATLEWQGGKTFPHQLKKLIPGPKSACIIPLFPPRTRGIYEMSGEEDWAAPGRRGGGVYADHRPVVGGTGMRSGPSAIARPHRQTSAGSVHSVIRGNNPQGGRSMHASEIPGVGSGFRLF